MGARKCLPATQCLYSGYEPEVESHLQAEQRLCKRPWTVQERHYCVKVNCVVPEFQNKGSKAGVCITSTSETKTADTIPNDWPALKVGAPHCSG